MICAHCKSRDVTVAHVKACSTQEQSIRSIGKYDYKVEVPRDRIVTEALAPLPEITVEEFVAKVRADHPRARITEPGVYFDGERYFKVVRNQNGDRLYAKIWDAEWLYAPGALQTLYADQRVTAEEAAQFGKLWGSCVFCTKQLTDERSVAVGYGPTCAAREGLPWGEKVS